MNNFSVIIPSRNVDNLRPCVEAIRAAGETCRIIVVEDSPEVAGTHLLDGLGPIELRHGVQPFVFARNVNIGIRAAGEHDVILLNDDALLKTVDGFTDMHANIGFWNGHASETGGRLYGVVSATTNLAGNPAQQRMRNSGLRLCPCLPGHTAPVVAFVCVLIPRSTINAVGLLDERFTAYGWEDNDYCRRVDAAGLSIAIDDGCYVDHASLHSTFRGQAYAAGDINAGRKIYLEKWGHL